jgi:hypothetical protein
MPSTRDPIELLKSLQGRARPASEHFAAAPTAARSAPPLDELLPHAERLKIDGKTCYRVTQRVDLGTGRSEAGYACPAADYDVRRWGESLALLGRDPRWADIDPERIAYIDTETTGLAGGTGTFVFLIGVGRFDGCAFEVRQYFMEDFADEGAMLAAVDEELARVDAIASYNGKCFDAPLMESRWRLARRRPAFPALHFDLLYPARRLWRLKCADCTLGSIERDVLGVMRVSDIESHLIPRIYFDYVEGLRRTRILPVFDHHAQDIFSLGALARAMARAVEAPEDPRFAHAGEQFGLAGVYFAAGRVSDQLAALERAIVAARDEELGFRFSMHLARRLKQLGRIEEAVEIWTARAGQARADRLDPLIELAKHAEHRLRDFEAARMWTERAIEIAGGESADDLRHRLDRILRRGGRGEE